MNASNGSLQVLAPCSPSLQRCYQTTALQSRLAILSSLPCLHKHPPFPHKTCLVSLQVHSPCPLSFKAVPHILCDLTRRSLGLEHDIEIRRLHTTQLLPFMKSTPGILRMLLEKDSGR